MSYLFPHWVTSGFRKLITKLINIKRMFGLGKKNLRFPNVILFMKSKGANSAWLCIILYYYWWYRNILLEGSDFPGK